MGWGAHAVDQQTKRPCLLRKIGDSRHTAPHQPPSSHIIQAPSNASSLVGYSPVDHDNKERRVNNVQAASAAVGGVFGCEEHNSNRDRGSCSAKSQGLDVKL